MQIETTAMELAEAQAALDFHPNASPFWDSLTGQDMLTIADEFGLHPRTTDAQRLALYRVRREVQS